MAVQQASSSDKRLLAHAEPTDHSIFTILVYGLPAVGHQPPPDSGAIRSGGSQLILAPEGAGVPRPGCRIGGSSLPLSHPETVARSPAGGGRCPIEMTLDMPSATIGSAESGNARAASRGLLDRPGEILRA